MMLARCGLAHLHDDPIRASAGTSVGLAYADSGFGDELHGVNQITDASREFTASLLGVE
jgi:hypothetical protein